MEAHGKNYSRPSPEILNKEEHYEVEAILDSKCQGQGTKYLVKWVRYPEVDNTWEPFAFLKEQLMKPFEIFIKATWISPDLQ